MAIANISRCLKGLRKVPAKWHRRTHIERLLLLEALTLLGMARLLVLCIPFRWLAVLLGKPRQESDPRIGPAELRVARMIGRAVRSAANNTPWESVCLPQAVTAQWMLKRRRIAATLYLGVAKKNAGPEHLAAHAWLRCGDTILTGAAGHKRFTIVGTFAPNFS